MIHTMSNSCSEPMIDRKIQIRIVGPSSGSVTRRVVCQDVAPSIAAASRSSSGIALEPGEQEDDPEADVLPRDHDEQRVEDDARRPATAARARRGRRPQDASTKPSGWRSCSQITAVIASDSTYGANTTSRRNARPRSRRLSSSASADAERELDQQRQRRDRQVVQHRVLEDVVRQRALVVVEADEVGHRAEAVPVVEAVVRSDADRHQHEADEQHERRAEQQRQLEPLRLPAAGRASADSAASLDGRHSSSDGRSRLATIASPSPLPAKKFATASSSACPRSSATRCRSTSGCMTRSPRSPAPS